MKLLLGSLTWPDPIPHLMLFDVIEGYLTSQNLPFSACSIFLASVLLSAELEMDEFDILANAYCDCEELTDFKFDSLANKFCDSEELIDFRSEIL